MSEWDFMQGKSNEGYFPAHFDGKRFYNPGSAPARGLLDVLRWKLTTRPERSPRLVSDVRPSTPPPRVDGDEMRTTLVNHSTVLLQQKTSNILTDPIWSDRTSPLSWIGPRRRRAPGVLREDLPPIDIVLLSHNHFDHLDLPTLRWLAGRGNSAFVVPIGVARLLQSQKIGPVHELDWGESLTLGDTTVHAVQALHFSARSINDRNKTLWCGYVIQARGRIVYFAGDTGLGSHFAQIREKFGSPQLSLLPIGAYKPRWFMSPIHMAPDEALRAHQILGSRTSIAIHHGTFQLADDGIDTAQQQLSQSRPPDSFVILRNGQWISVSMIIDRHTLAVVSILGSSLEVLGALYLAYDLLGGEHGPLRVVTRAVTYGAMFALGFGLALGPVFGLISGASHGVTLAWEFSRASQQRPRPGFWFDVTVSAIRGITYTIGAAFLFGAAFGITFGALSTVGQVIGYRAGIRPTVDYAPATRPRLTKRQFLGALNRTVGYAIAGYVSALVGHQQVKALTLGLEAGLLVGVVTAIVSACVPFVEWNADHLPARRMGVVGVGLILLGFVLQSVQYWVTLLDLQVR